MMFLSFALHDPDSAHPVAKSPAGLWTEFLQNLSNFDSALESLAGECACLGFTSSCTWHIGFVHLSQISFSNHHDPLVPSPERSFCTPLLPCPQALRDHCQLTSRPLCVDPFQAMLDQAKDFPHVDTLCQGAVEFAQDATRKYDRALLKV